MPRKTQTRRRPDAGYHEGHIRQLLIGHDFGLPAPAFGRDEAFRREEAIEAWAMLREELLHDHIQEHPCTRPWAWWHLEHRELRRRVDGGIHPCENPDRRRDLNLDDGTSRPGVWYGLPRRITHPDDFDAVYESVPAYLLRLNLLTRAEREYLDENPDLLEPGDFGRGW
jgi:hypothetical protein